MNRSIVVFVCLALPLMSIAQASSPPDKGWQFNADVYLMFPNMKGSTAIRNLPEVDVDADINDIFSNLKFGAMLYVEAKKNKWAFGSDLLYMDLEQDITPGTLVSSGVAKASQLGWELSALRKLNDFLEAGIGARLNYIDASVDLNQKTVGGGTVPRSGSIAKTWVDPIIITRMQYLHAERWRFIFRGDIGGFGIGSDLTWQVQGYIGYQLVRLFSVSVGYRVIGVDYSTGSGTEYFLYDVNTFGPVLRFGLHF